MTTFYFMRHGQPDNSVIGTKIYQGMGANMMTLTEKGKEEIHRSAKDERLKKAQLILASPYGRALHTAAIVSRELDLDIQVETDLYEWVADAENFSYLEYEEAVQAYHELYENKGHHPVGKHCKWESSEHLIERVKAVLEKYRDYECVIVCCHGTLMEFLLNMDHHPVHGEIVEFKL